MLLEYAVENYRSLRNLTVLSLTAKTGLKDFEKNLIPFGKERVLKEAVIFGANGSGKSALLESIEAMQTILNNATSINPEAPIPEIKPFLFDKDSPDKPTSFQITFEIDGLKYIYGFSADRTEIKEEYLYFYKSTRISTVFERDGQIFKAPGKWKKFINQYKPMVKPNSLFLGVIGKLNADTTEEVFSKVYLWIVRSIAFARPSFLEQFGKIMLKHNFLEDEKRKELVLGLMAKADFSITDYDIKFKEADLGDFNSGSDSENDRKRAMIADLMSVDDSKTFHEINGTKYSLSLFDESDGTRKYLYLLPKIIQTLEDGGVLIIDEIETSLHPFLIRELIDLFRYEDTNPKNAQLIFSTHDVLLLEIGGLRRDQIYFMEKDRETQTTELYSLADFSPRKDENYLKNYLLGRYGGVPNLKDSFWEND